MKKNKGNSSLTNLARGDAINLISLQHEPGSTTGHCESTTACSSLGGKRLNSMLPADAIIKDEPDFVETHCHWAGCDRDLHTQEQLVKVTHLREITHF